MELWVGLLLALLVSCFWSAALVRGRVRPGSVGRCYLTGRSASEQAGDETWYIRKAVGSAALRGQGKLLVSSGKDSGCSTGAGLMQEPCRHGDRKT